MHHFLRMAAALLLAAASLFGAAAGAQTAPRMLGKYMGPIPEKYAALAALGGVRTGNLNASPQNTAYIFFDPNCGWCKRAYQESLQYGAHVSIQWLPVNILRRNARAEQQAASVLVGGAAARANLQAVMAGARPEVGVTQEMRRQLRQNEALLRSLLGQRTSVPTAVILDRTQQRPATLAGATMHTLYGAP